MWEFGCKRLDKIHIYAFTVCTRPPHKEKTTLHVNRTDLEKKNSLMEMYINIKKNIMTTCSTILHVKTYDMN